MRRWLLLASVALSVSAFTVHQHSQQEQCLELQCPSTAFEYGIRNLVSEETLRSDRCQSCQQCTANGYSICMKMSDSRGRRGSQTEGCSCTHSIPANCHSEPSRQPPNMTMTAFNICYLSALQAPPRPLAVNNKESVIVTVEPFWTEPYWRDLQMENLTLHYEFAVQKPEHCEGELVTNEGERLEHYCKDSVKLEMDGPLDTENKNEEEEYEHSDDYKEYDDSLPPEVAFDRDVFDGAKLLKAYYSVQVRRPRQLAAGSPDPFRDQTTMLDSEMLKFDLKPEVYGTGIPELPPAPAVGKDDDVLPATEAPAKEEDEDTSDEHGEGTNFFEEDAKEPENDTKSEEEQEKEDAELEKKIGEMEASSTAKSVAATTEEEKKKSVEKEEEDEEEETKKEEKEEDKEEEDEDEDEDEKKDKSRQKEEIDKPHKDDKARDPVESEEKKEEADSEDDGDDEEATTAGEEDDEATVTEEDEVEKEDKSEEAKDSEEETDEQTPSSTEKTITLLGHKFTKWPLARLVFFVCLCSFLLILSLWCCRKCCCKSEEKTTANGYRYSNPNSSGRNDLVCPPEKERLHQ